MIPLKRVLRKLTHYISLRPFMGSSVLQSDNDGGILERLQNEKTYSNWLRLYRGGIYPQASVLTWVRSSTYLLCRKNLNCRIRPETLIYGLNLTRKFLMVIAGQNWNAEPHNSNPAFPFFRHNERCGCERTSRIEGCAQALSERFERHLPSKEGRAITIL